MNITRQIQELRNQAQRSDHLLTVDLVKRLGAFAERVGSESDLPDLRTPEFGKSEYLLNCDPNGVALVASSELTDAIQRDPHPDPAWVRIRSGNVLALRWLCHFIGFRHRAIHLFLDHPDHPDATFVQVRSLSKYNSPGLFDMPVGGHVDATDTPRESLRKELGEELGLDDRTDLIEVNEIGTYNIAIPNFQPNYAEVDHTTLYRATIRPESVSRFRLQEGEAGGLVLFKRDELNRWIIEFPDRVGGGLIDSWKYYSCP